MVDLTDLPQCAEQIKLHAEQGNDMIIIPVRLARQKYSTLAIKCQGNSIAKLNYIKGENTSCEGEPRQNTIKITT